MKEDEEEEVKEEQQQIDPEDLIEKDGQEALERMR